MKDELMEVIQSLKIICADIRFWPYREGKECRLTLKVGHSEADLSSFLQSIDIEAGIENKGTFIWLEDDHWVSVGEYDGHTFFVLNKMPEIPEELI